MAERCARSSRRGKGIMARFNKLKRLAGEMKSRRETFAQCHNLMVDLVTAPPFSVLTFLPMASPSTCSPSPCNRRELLQQYNVWDACEEPSFLLKTSRSLPVVDSKISTSAMDSSCKVDAALSLISDVMERKASALNTSITNEEGPPRHSIAALPVMVPSIFWAGLVLVLLCTFLCTGKEVAVAFTMVAYFILWVTFRSGLLGNHQIRSVLPLWRFKDHIPDRMNRPVKRSSRLPPHLKDTCQSHLSFRPAVRSRSWPQLYDCKDDDVHNIVSQSKFGAHSSRHILGLMLVLALCGLVHGKSFAVFITLGWLLLLSKMPVLFSRKL